MPKADAPTGGKPGRTSGPAIDDKPASQLDSAGGGDPGRVSILDTGTDLDEAYEFVNGCWYGPQGTGKTTDLAAMAHLGKVIYINAEGGLKRKPLKKLGIPVENITVLPQKPEQLTYEWLEELYWELSELLERDPDAIAGVAWDSITEIHKVLLRNVSVYQNERAKRRGESRLKNAAPGDILNDAFTDLSDYGIMADQMRLMLRRYRDLPCHFAVSALERRDVDDDGRVVYRPAVTPALINDLLGFMDVVAHTSTKEFDDDGDEEYQGLFRPIGKYRGKDRFKSLPPHLVDPTFLRVVQYVNDDIELDTDDVMQAALERRGGAKRIKSDAPVAQATAEEAEPASE